MEAFALIGILIATLAGLEAELIQNADSSWSRVLTSSKISEELKGTLRRLTNCSGGGGEIDIMVEFHGRDDHSPFLDFHKDPIHSLQKRDEKRSRGKVIEKLVGYLKGYSDKKQRAAMLLLKNGKFNFTQLWLEHELFVKGADCPVIAALSQLEEVRLLRIPAVIHEPEPFEADPIQSYERREAKADSVSWNLLQMNARCSDIKCLGKGAVVAIIDTGVRSTHVELVGRLRPGWNWLDPYNMTEVPVDSKVHGTHVAGIAVGNTVGVAPEAQYIACMALYLHSGTEETVKLCMQWALCPWLWNATTDADRDASKNCSMAPHIVNMSLGGRADEDSPWYFYQRTIIAWNEAEIMHTMSAGNLGPFCTSVKSPAMLDVSFAIGNTNINLTIQWHSSRGPSYYPAGGEFNLISFLFNQGPCRKQCGGGVITSLVEGVEVCTLTKPNVSAPGTNINSSLGTSDTLYKSFSGTSMAAPAVAGVLALMYCANNGVPNNNVNLTQYDAVDILQQTASTAGIDLQMGYRDPDKDYLFNPSETSYDICQVACGDSCNAAPWPNNMYGYGIVDACQAVLETIRRVSKK